MRTLSGWVIVLLLLATGAGAAGVPRATRLQPGNCSSAKPVSDVHASPASFLATLRSPSASSLTDDCLPPDQSCFYYASGDCLDCWDDFGHRGTSICDSWLCAPSGALYTCCSECTRFSC
jgi:hypothetical protein